MSESSLDRELGVDGFAASGGCTVPPARGALCCPHHCKATPWPVSYLRALFLLNLAAELLLLQPVDLQYLAITALSVRVMSFIR